MSVPVIVNWEMAAKIYGTNLWSGHDDTVKQGSFEEITRMGTMLDWFLENVEQEEIIRMENELFENSL